MLPWSATGLLPTAAGDRWVDAVTLHGATGRRYAVVCPEARARDYHLPEGTGRRCTFTVVLLRQTTGWRFQTIHFSVAAEQAGHADVV